MTEPTINHTASAEQSDQAHEANLIIANFNQLSVPLLQAETARATSEAEDYLRRGLADPSSEEALSPLIALSLASNSLGLELGQSGIMQQIVMDAHPDKAIRDEAKKQQATVQDISDGVFAYEQYREQDAAKYEIRKGLHDILRTMDSETLDEQDKQRHVYFLGQFEKANSTVSQETTENDPRKDLATAQGEFLENAKKTADIVLSSEEAESLSADVRQQLGISGQASEHTVTVSQASLPIILENAGNRGLRQRAYEAYYGDQVAENDGLAQQMATLRKQIAMAAGAESWTALQVQGLTLDTPEKITELRDSVQGDITQRYQATVDKLQALLTADNPSAQIQEYDLDYYRRKLTEESYDASKITFSFDKTVSGLYEMAGKLLGVGIQESPDTPVWADGVRAYTVHDVTSGEDLGTIFLDPFVRDGKRNNSATYALRYGLTEDHGGNEEVTQLPMTVALTNLTAPGTDGQEAKMSLREVEVFAHEALGHALHIVMGRSRGPESAYDKVPFDGIEIVSQMFEYMVKDPNLLLSFANEGIPDNVREDFLQTQDTVQQDFFALNGLRLLRTTAFDLAMHGTNPDLGAALQEVEELMAPVGTDGHWPRMQRHEANTYAGRYYTYLLCDAKAKALVAWIRQNNYSPAVGAELRSVLAMGGQPGANEKLLALAARGTASRGVGGAALSSGGTVIPEQ